MASDDYRTDANNLYSKYLLKTIAQENIDVIEVLQRIVTDVLKETNKNQQPLSMNGLRQHQPVYLNHVIPRTEGKLS
jgi:predicted nucleotide-binding protein (sugar kinase/HSP70/actin superfamily)